MNCPHGEIGDKTSHVCGDSRPLRHRMGQRRPRRACSGAWKHGSVDRGRGSCGTNKQFVHEASRPARANRCTPGRRRVIPLRVSFRAAPRRSRVELPATTRSRYGGGAPARDEPRRGVRAPRSSRGIADRTAVGEPFDLGEFGAQSARQTGDLVDPEGALEGARDARARRISPTDECDPHRTNFTAAHGHTRGASRLVSRLAH